MRAERYNTLGDALFSNPDLRFPNLDAVLPLPPATLPQWDGKPESLIEKAQGVRPKPQPPKRAASGQISQAGRANIPEGQALVLPPEYQHFAQTPITGFNGVFRSQVAREGLARAPLAGYYQPRHVRSEPLDGFKDGVDEAQRWQALQGLPPLYFGQGEAMHLRGSTGSDYWFAQDGDHASVVWTFAGMAQSIPAASLTDWLAHSGVLRSIETAGTQSCRSGQPCPQTGIWQPFIQDPEHPLATSFGDNLASEGWRRQAFVQAGQPMPSMAQQLGAALGDEDEARVVWRLVQATEMGA